jgi:hypothetical protein
MTETLIDGGQRVTQSLSEKAVSDKDIVDAANREIMPAAKQIRRAVNARFGKIVLVTSDYTVPLDVETVLVDASLGPVTITLPAPGSSTMEIQILKIDATANTVTIV